MDVLVSIGQLSAIMGVSVRTIRYYEEIGLLKPCKTTEANYRYYGKDEKETLAAILLLKRMGFPLHEIKIVLSGNEPDSFRIMIRDRQRKLELEMKEIRARQELLETVLANLNSTMEDQRSGFSLPDTEAVQRKPLSAIHEMLKSGKTGDPLTWNNGHSIKVIGIGSHVSKFLRCLSTSDARMDLIYVDSDEQVLLNSKAGCKIQLAGGAGSNREDGDAEAAVYEEMDQIRRALTAGELLFILGSLDDTLSSTAMSIIAREAGQMDLLTVGVASFSSLDAASERRIAQLEKDIDLLLHFPRDPVQDNTGSAYPTSDSFIEKAVVSLSSLILSAHLDLRDIKKLAGKKGIAFIAIGEASGKNRVPEAMEQVFDSPTLYKNIGRAASVLIHITGSNDLTIPEVDRIVHTVSERVHPEANVLFGTVIDHEAHDFLAVTVVTTGYPMPERSEEARSVRLIRNREGAF